MGYKSGGLSYFSDGSSTTETEEQKSGTFQAKPTAGKGKFALPSPAGNISMSQSVLDQMEQLYMERQADRGGFMESLKDASAWFSGGVRGPQAALLARDKFKQEQQAEDLQMGSQLAQYRSAIAAQKAFEQRRNQELGIGGAQPGAAPGAPSNVKSMFGMPPEIRQALLNAKTEADYNKIYADWAKKRAEVEANPEYDVPKIPVVIKGPNGEYFRDVISPRQLRANPERYIPQDQPQAPGGVPTSYKPGPGPAPPSAAAPAPLQTAQQPDAQAAQQPDAQAAQQSGAPVQTAAPTPQGGAQPPMPAPQTGAQPPMGASSMAPVAPMAQAHAPVRNRPPTAEELLREAELKRDVSKKELVGGIEVQQNAEKDLVKDFLAQTNPMKTEDRKFRASKVAELVQSDPRIAGILSETGYGSALAGLLSKGISTPSGSISVGGISDAIAKTIPGMDMEKRMELAKYLANMELDASAMMQGQGQISDSERYILRNSAINIDDPAAVVYKTAKIMERRQRMMEDMRSLYGDGKRWRGSYSGFENSPQAKQILGQYYKDLQSISNEKIKLGGKKSGPTEGQTSKSKSGKPIVFKNGNWEYQ